MTLHDRAAVRVPWVHGELTSGAWLLAPVSNLSWWHRNPVELGWAVMWQPDFQPHLILLMVCRCPGATGQQEGGWTLKWNR